MRAVYWKELRELALVGIPLAIAAGFTGWEFSSHGGETDELLGLVILGGLALGIAHGLLDRQRRDDLFLRHRPLPRGRLEAARTAAGATVLVVAVAVLLVFLVWGAAHHADLLSRIARMRSVDGDHAAAWHAAHDVLGGRIAPRQVTVGLAAYVLLSSAAVWAGLRWIFSARRLWQIPLLLLAVPFLLAAPVGRMDSLAGALALMAVIAAACTWQVVARRRALVTLFLCGWLLFEGAASLRAATQEIQFGVYPAYGVNDTGEIYSWNLWGDGVHAYDLERNELPLSPERHPYRRLFTFHPGVRTAFWNWVDRVPPYFEQQRPPRWARATEAWLNIEQARLPNGSLDRAAPLVWRFEGGRFLCRDRDSGTVVAGFGPDGYTAGPGAAASERFEDVTGFGPPGIGNVVVVDESLEHRFFHLRHRRGTFDLAIDDQPGRSRGEPIRVGVSWQPRKVLSSFTSHISGIAGGERKVATTSLIQHGDRLALVRGDETLASVPWDENSEQIVQSGLFPTVDLTVAGIATLVQPPHPAFATYRLRVLRPQQEPIVHDIVVQPETALEHAIAGFGGLVALGRPLPFVLASYRTGAPDDFGAAASWWWRDPWFSGQRMTGWLVAAVLLTALLAWWARRQALLRCASMRAVHFWTAVAVVLGPLGMIWMRLTLPWAPVEPVGSGARAVNRDATPVNDTPWPEPTRVGTEVFSR